MCLCSNTVADNLDGSNPNTAWSYDVSEWKLHYIHPSSSCISAFSLVDIILRDGVMYFAVIFSSNLLNTLVFFVRRADFRQVADAKACNLI